MRSNESSPKQPAHLPWYRSSVIYQIYPWSFKDSNADGIGDLKGIIEKLDYLRDNTPNSLNVGAIWISPIYPSPMKDYGYDISDYCGIDNRFGNLETFDELVREARARGIKIIMDLVTNHTSDQHPWFIESSSSKDNPKRNWYIWHDPKPDGSPPNNWVSVSGGSMWTLDEKTGQYYLHNFLPEQPDLNWRNQEVRDEMKKIIEFWIRRGVNGFRLDAASHFIEDSEFRDDPLNATYVPDKDEPYHQFAHTFSTNQPEVKEVIGMMCDICEENDDIFIVSETYLGLEDIKKFYRFCNAPVHAPFNFQLMSLPWTAGAFRNAIDTYEAALRPEDVPIYVMGNHDRIRLASQRGLLQSRSAAVLLLTLRGTPFVYYGEELGMQNVGIPKEKMKDGFIRDLGHTYSRDPERTPMQWNPRANAGFSEHEPWLPVSKDFDTVNVEIEEKDPTSMLNLYKALINFRNGSEALLQGEYRSHKTDSEHIFAYTRETDSERILVLINFSGATITESITPGTFTLVCTSHMDIARGTEFKDTITLRPHEACILQFE